MGEKKYRSMNICLSNNADDLELHFCQIRGPAVYTAESMMRMRTREEFAELIGIPINEWKRNGIDYDSPIFELAEGKSPDDDTVFENLEQKLDELIKRREKEKH